MEDRFGADLPQVRRLVTDIPGPRSSAINDRRAAAVSSALSEIVPIVAERAGGGVILDVDGNSLIDLGSGIAVTTVGNAAPEVADAVSRQVRSLTHTCFMVAGYEGYIEVCERLNKLTPGDHDKRSALFNSGADAIENAVKIARCATGRNAVVAFEHGYHGRTYMAMALTAKNMPYKQSFGPFPSDVHRMPTSYPLRDGLDGPAAAARATSRMETEIGAHNIAAVVIEPIQGEGGFIVPAAGFLQAIADWARCHGVVFVADEVQTGFCRTGDWFACDREGLVPDLVVTAKGIAGGMPLSAVTGRADLMNSVHVGGLGGTYGGNPAACAAAIATIDVMSRDEMWRTARAMEVVIRDRLDALQESCDLVAEVRGRGAMMAIEFAEPGTLKPIRGLAQKVVAECGSKGVVALTAGTYGNVIRLLPPLVIGHDLLSEGLDIVSEVVLGVEAEFRTAGA